MTLIHKLQLFFHQYFLGKSLSKKAKEISRDQVSFEKAKTIGILFDATDFNIREVVLNYAKKLKHKGKRVKLLGYFDNALENENFTFAYFNRKNIDWALRPGGEKVQNFISQPFDIFINLETETKIHSEYIAALSYAKLKVGPITENTYCYDLMIDPVDKNDLAKFIQDIEKLLEKTNNRHETAQV